jgi:hypothetical protein
VLNHKNRGGVFEGAVGVVRWVQTIYFQLNGQISFLCSQTVSISKPVVESEIEWDKTKLDREVGLSFGIHKVKHKQGIQHPVSIRASIHLSLTS